MPFNSSNNNPHFFHGPDQAVNGPVVGIQERGAFQQVLGRIPAQGQFGKNSKITSRFFSSPYLSKDNFKVTVKIPDHGIYLDKGYLHGSGQSVLFIRKSPRSKRPTMPL
jgi:hypothetical protein